MQMIFVNGVGLEVRRLDAPAGAPARAPLVFLHEGLGSVAMWRDWPQQLCEATGRAGIVYSRQGYGASDPVPDVRGTGRLRPDYMHREAFEVLPGLLRALDVAAPVLLGHSDGGTIALLHASRHPVGACVVMAPHVLVEDVSIASIAQARDAFLAGPLRERLARYHRDVDVAFWQWNDVWLSQGFRAFDIRADCRRIAAPVLAMQGLDDAYGTLRQIEEIAPTAGRFETEVVPDCGHSPHRDQPGVVTARIASFLAALP
ncbi:MAG TPA: alpha/beta hydrolase [Ramlibacter sp.]|jgi:pimeloyl-ACP methyl ester carboxylesterase|uniref:alpha/beta fold hydrolase n=1 Tax=Ramlibacter sp. TaxID=1917967 RepID=UPI002D331F20|nr:alpha/beta hydrolase [Ramlibacter sp.]HZY20528.1 alpha/beta hydrolase [Ramlibacter sp.]